MNIWPWSRIKEIEERESKWIQNYMNVHKSRAKILRYLDSIRPGQHHVCVADRLYIFKPEGTWFVAENNEETPYAPI